MRVRRFGLARVREERGATLAIVAISLICLLGMLVLTFDLGRSVALKRNMVNGADAAALAAARECALANGEGAAKAAAVDLLADNNGTANVTSFKINPSPAVCSGAPNPNPDGKNTVTVGVTVPVQYYFAPIFGVNNGSVVAEATAMWESGVVNPAPLKLDLVPLKVCLDNPVGYAGTECAFGFNNDVPGAQSGSQRGILDFPEGWPEPPDNPGNCTSQKGGANDFVNYINQMGLLGPNAFRAVMWANPMYVCAQGGLSAVGVKAIVDWINATAKKVPPVIVQFPVVAPNCPAPDCKSWITTPGKQAYPVIDFVGMQVVGAWKGQEAKQHCDFTGKSGGKQGSGSGGVSSDVFCVQLKVADPKYPGANGEDVVVRLVD